MKFKCYIFIINFLFFKNVFNYKIYSHSEELIFVQKFNILLISELKTNENIIEIKNKSFYYYNKTKDNFENIILNYTPIIYFENIDDFFESKNMIKKYSNYINSIIINSNNTNYIKNININSDILIFLYNDNYYNDLIKENYNFFDINNTCNIKIFIKFKIDIILKYVSLSIFIFICLLLLFWAFIYVKSIKQSQNLFVHSILLIIIFLYFIHSILFMRWIYSFNYNNIENNYSLYNYILVFARIFLFFIKILIGFCICIQFNIIELREHYNIINESKSPLIHLMIVAFIICFEHYSSFMKNKNIYISASEIFNFFYYLFFISIFFYRYLNIRKIIDQRVIDAFSNRELGLFSLLIKKNILRKHSYIFISLFAFIIMIYFYITFFLNEYKNRKLAVLLLHYYDIILLIGLIIVYFPFKIDNYYIEYSFLEGFNYFKNKNRNQKEIIYKSKYINEDEEEYLLSENDLELFLIENPFYNDNINENEKSDNWLNIKRVKIGYKYNELNDKIYLELKRILSLNQK